HREETSRYTLLMPDGKARQFAFVQEVNSVITAPCPEHPLRHGPGPYEVSGLAWSGRGRIKRVDLSTDGGTTWQTARLQAPVLSRAVTRFRFAWAWNGREALLQSRALDETGALQPDAAALKAERGLNSAYHRNAIQTWRLAPDGKVDNVQLG
ncbi:MAG: sulfite dehydrogenase, partial [Alphaproteobacteria bacterium]|nr:sulfite dehydrogenase [Alphaproteobacteria bacterium]